jgi:hypothetical protein
MVRKIKVEPSLRRNFLESLLAKSRGRTAHSFKLWDSAPDFIVADAGITGVSFRCVVGLSKSRVELFIAHRDSATNQRIYDELRSHKREIEDEFGKKLSWQPLEGSKSCRIAFDTGDGAKHDAKWHEVQTDMIKAMVRLEKALSPHIARLQ